LPLLAIAASVLLAFRWIGAVPRIHLPAAGADGGVRGAEGERGRAADATGGADAAQPALRWPRARVGSASAHLAACQREIEALPRAPATRRGTAARDFLAILSAVDAALGGAQADGSGRATPASYPAALLARLEAEDVRVEADAVVACTFQAGALPAGFAAAVRGFLRRHGPFGPQGGPGGGWRAGALASLLEPGNATAAESVLLGNDAFDGWLEPGSRLLNPALALRQPALQRLAALAPNSPLLTSAADGVDRAR
jgi:hypothetical protein